MKIENCSGVLLLAMVVGCSGDDAGAGGSSRGTNNAGGDSAVESDGTGSSEAGTGDSNGDAGDSTTDTGSSTAGAESVGECTYDTTDKSGGWAGESEDGCATDRFKIWQDWECDPGVLTGTIAKFWEKDTIPEDDPDYTFNDRYTYIDAADETARMGVFLLSVDPVVLSSVDFLVEFPADLLEFTHIERHWASIAQDEPPSSPENVELVAPGLLKFTWSMEECPRVVHKGDIPVASIYFDVLASGEGNFDFVRPDSETWDNYQPPYKWVLKSDVSEARPVWATTADGREGPVPWQVNSTIVIR